VLRCFAFKLLTLKLIVSLLMLTHCLEGTKRNLLERIYMTSQLSECVKCLLNFCMLHRYITKHPLQSLWMICFRHHKVGVSRSNPEFITMPQQNKFEKQWSSAATTVKSLGSLDLISVGQLTEVVRGNQPLFILCFVTNGNCSLTYYLIAQMIHIYFQ